MMEPHMIEFAELASPVEIVVNNVGFITICPIFKSLFRVIVLHC